LQVLNLGEIIYSKHLKLKGYYGDELKTELESQYHFSDNFITLFYNI